MAALFVSHRSSRSSSSSISSSSSRYSSYLSYFCSFQQLHNKRNNRTTSSESFTKLPPAPNQISLRHQHNHKLHSNCRRRRITYFVWNTVVILWWSIIIIIIISSSSSSVTTVIQQSSHHNSIPIWCHCFEISSLSRMMMIRTKKSVTNTIQQPYRFRQSQQSQQNHRSPQHPQQRQYQRASLSSKSILFYYNHNSNHHHNYNSRPPQEPRSFTTTTTTTKNKKKESWRKQIHVSDEVPVVPAASSSSNHPPNKTLQFHDTPLGKNGLHLLDGLDHYTVYATDDGHPLSVYGIQSELSQMNHNNNGASESSTTPTKAKKPILLLHGRTWSSVPVYHLLGGPFAQQQQQAELSHDGTTTLSATNHSYHESRSLMEALLQKGLQPYCMDFRGFGGTHIDPKTQCVEPYRCVQDAEYVLQWIQQRHLQTTLSTTTTTTTGTSTSTSTNNSTTATTTTNSGTDHNNMICNDETAIPALLGWSQGALVAQLIAQRNFHHTVVTPSSSTSSFVSPKPLISKLILYGSIYDPLVRYPREPLYVSSSNNNNNNNNNNASNKTTTIRQQPNTFDAAIEDFTVEGTIPPEPARLFAEAALLSDPTKVIWKNLYQFNNCDPARVHVPCLVIAGDQDPYAPLHVQQELFCNLARASDRTWSILSGSDHACHLLDGRDRLINTVVSFVMNGKRTEPRF